MFLTLEDGWWLSNAVVRPDVYDRFRSLCRLEPLLVGAETAMPASKDSS